MTTKPTPADFEPVTMPSAFDYLVDLTEREGAEGLDDYDRRTIQWAVAAVIVATLLFVVWFVRYTGAMS